MRLTAEYLEQARHFDCIAREENGWQLRREFEQRADAYRKLAEARAKKLGISLAAPATAAERVDEVA